ncbi:hypothetical protein SMKI_13G4180 [Saccharomyces mikatae IFO 1815]|uniref:Dynein light intermediate chain n=1 Tax=Saccharomyces mikatae IFO 1815 TaxID=226126 RepID=A0AA35ISN4_SACMI|nr:uncharacterized protein SMKI_13G4180 [Saccharomyces mikatae IFO 1815]CAI4035766.1 hypothetical protein SMKI_13G4180 [Saccharomyces mikatae IFO 1815]
MNNGYAWDELLAQSKSVINNKESEGTTAVIYSPSSKTLHQFINTCFPEGTNSILDTDLINYATINWTNNLEQSYCSNVYTLVKNTRGTLDLLKPFLQEHASKIHWLILLDWSLNDQKLWLNELSSTFSEIKQLNDNNEFSIWCLNSNEIINLQRNTTAWQSVHIDFILQTLRSFCYLNDSSLFYICEDRTEEEDEEIERVKYPEVLKHFIEGRDMKEYVEMVKRSRISIPKGCDSIGLIKTIDERFEPTVVGEDLFLARYIDFIPEMDEITDNKKTCTVTDLDKLYPLDAFRVNIQEELGKMFTKQKENSKI